MKILSQIQILFLSIALILLSTSLSSNTSTYSNQTSSNSSSSSSNSSTSSNQTSYDYIKRSCNLTLYKTLCNSTLSPYASKIDSNPHKLAVISLDLTITSAKSAASVIKDVSHRSNLTSLEAAAVADCVEEIGDSVSELQDSMRELDSVNYNDSLKFEMVMSDVETWVSAALTCHYTCMDNFSQAKGAVQDLVRQYVLQVARLTSNALALINMYAETH